MKILGLHHGGHDTAASITINGKLIAACEEERYNKESILGIFLLMLLEIV